MDVENRNEITEEVDEWLGLETSNEHWREHFGSGQEKALRSIASAWADAYYLADIGTQRNMAFAMNDEACSHLNAADGRTLLTRFIADKAGLAISEYEIDVQLIHAVFFREAVFSEGELSAQLERMKELYPDGVDFRIKYINKIANLEGILMPERYVSNEERLQGENYV